jgi:hypothetical protein
MRSGQEGARIALTDLSAEAGAVIRAGGFVGIRVMINSSAA